MPKYSQNLNFKVTLGHAIIGGIPATAPIFVYTYISNLSLEVKKVLDY